MRFPAGPVALAALLAQIAGCGSRVSHAGKASSASAALAEGGPLGIDVMTTAAPPPPAFLVDLPDEERHGLPTNFTQGKAGDPVLPDLFASLTGARITTPAAWRAIRRPELLDLLAAHQFGRTPDAAISAEHDVWDAGSPAFGGLAIRTQVEIKLSSDAGASTMNVVLYLPAAAVARSSGRVPVILRLLFSPVVIGVDDEGVREVDGWVTTGPDAPRRVAGRDARSLGRVDVAAFVTAGVGVALIYYGEIEPDFAGGAALGVRRVFASTAGPSERAPGDWGAIGAWAWGASRVLDWLQAQPGVDPDRIAIQGFSRLGKTALWAAAQDERFAAVIDCCSGEGGQSLSRREYGETIAHITAPSAFAYWFAPRFADYARNPEALPVDAHMLLAAIAPRPVLLINGETDAWADPYGAFLAARAASPAWTLLGGTGIEPAADFPSLDTSVGGDLRYFIHSGGHDAAPTDDAAILAFLREKLIDQ